MRISDRGKLNKIEELIKQGDEDFIKAKMKITDKAVYVKTLPKYSKKEVNRLSHNYYVYANTLSKIDKLLRIKSKLTFDDVLARTGLFFVLIAGTLLVVRILNII